VTKVRADTWRTLCAKLDGVDAGAALATLRAFNAAVKTDIPFDPNVKDGRGTPALWPPKSNWANRSIRAAVRGLRGHLRRHLHLRRPEDRPRARVIDADGAPIGRRASMRPGEMVGGLFYRGSGQLSPAARA
jgi:tricarballylate dehydrogenase